MNDTVILDLAQRWKQIADRPQSAPHSDDAARAADIARRETFRECGNALLTLLATFGDTDLPSAG